MEVKAGYRQTEVGVIPEDWDEGDLGDLNPFITSGSRGYAKFYSETGAPFIRITNLSRESIDPDLSDLKYVDLPIDDSDRKRTQLQTNDVLISITADIGIIGHVNDSVGKPAYMNQHIALVRFNPENAHSRFISYYLASENAQKHFHSSKDSGAKAGMNLLTVRKIRIPRPPLPEQHAIATALSDVDALITSLDKLIAKKRDIKQAAMQELLTGKRRLPEFSGEWSVYKFGDIFQFLNTANNSWSDLSGNGDLKYIHYGDVHAKTTAFLDCKKDSLPLIDKSKIKNIPLVEDGDLVIADASEDYAGTGKSIEIVNATGEGVVAGLHTLLLRGDHRFLANGFKGYLQYIPEVKTSLIKVATGISVYGISKRNVGNIEIALPQVEEQTAIATILSDMDADRAALEQKRDKTKAIKQGMMQELLTGRIRLV